MELKEVLDYIGLSDAKDINEFKEKFEDKENGYAKRSLIGSEIGKTLGATTTKIKNIFKENEIEFEPEEIKDKQVADILSIGFTKVKSKIEELNSKVGQNNDEALKSLQENYSKLESSLKAEREAKKEVQSKYGELETKFTTFEKETKYKYEWDKVWGEVSKKLSPTVDPLKREGFEAIVKKTRKYDFDDKNAFAVFDTEGNRIKSDKKAGEFKDPVEDLVELAAKHDLIAKNPDGGKPANQPLNFQATETKPAVTRKLNARFTNGLV